MKDSVSKSQFNKEMKALEKENKIIDSKMSEYYKSKNNDTFDNVIFNLSFILLNVLVMFFLYLIYSNKEYGIYAFDVFIKNIINLKMPLNITLIALCIVVCKTISNVITIKLGSKNFRLVLSGRLVIKDVFYSRIGYNALPMYEYTLTSSRVS
ncbi:MAG: hypothetical protein IJW28_04890, partial [Clostridia bacterium]|nr:hypothetical protein [Clostridia bacterium]